MIGLESKNYRQAIIKKINPKFKKSFQIPLSAQNITSNNISNIPPEGIIINSPGIYTFTNNIDWNPNSDESTAITINGNNITLDLNGKKLNCLGNKLLTMGILSILSENNSIKNGNISNFNIYSIGGYLSKNINISNLTLCSLTNKDISNNPISSLFIECDTVKICKTTIKDINALGTGISGIVFFETNNTIISNSYIKNFKNNSGGCSGIVHILSNNAEISNTKIENFKTGTLPNPESPGHTCIGIVPTAVDNININKCTIRNMNGSCDDAHGISLFIAKNAEVSNCLIENIKDGIGGKGAKSTGIEVYGIKDQDSNIIICDCTARNISAINPGDKQCAGFSAAGNNIQFIRCKAENVKVYNENMIEDITIGLGTGFGWAADVRDEFIYPAVNTMTKYCTAKNCQVGFDQFYYQNSDWCNVKSICNGIDVLNLNCSQRILYCDECSECPQGPTYKTIQNIASNNYINKIVVIYCNQSC